MIELYVHTKIVDHLKETYDTHNLLRLTQKLPNAEQSIGFMKGVHEVIDLLASYAERGESE